MQTIDLKEIMKNNPQPPKVDREGIVAKYNKELAARMEDAWEHACERSDAIQTRDGINMCCVICDGIGKNTTTIKHTSDCPLRKGADETREAGR